MRILLKNGLVVDGTGSLGYVADVLINGEKIEKIAPNLESIPDARIIDASNRVICPGFIDLHNHADFNIAEKNSAEFFIRQGLTTLLIGLCGLGVAPATQEVEAYYADFGRKALGLDVKLYGNTEDFISTLEKKGTSLNCALLIPHGNVRACVMGLEPRPAVEEEMKRMKDMIRENMEQGAYGMSTGLVYPPGSITPTEELIELSKIVAEYDGIYNSHMRNEGAGLIDIGMTELIRISRESGVRGHISHWSSISRYEYEQQTKDAIALVKSAHDEGLKITADVVPFPDGVTSLPFIILETWVFQNFKENLTDPETRKRIKKEIFQKLYSMFLSDAPWYMKLIPKFLLRRFIMPVLAKTVLILQHKRETYNGKTIYEALKGLYPDKKLEDALLDFIRDEEGGIVITFTLKNEERSVIPLYKQPFVAPCSDAIVLEGNNHPRTSSTFARVLDRWVREMKVISLEEAIKKQTSIPAKVLNIKDRGTLKSGNYADVVVFDPARIRQVATLENGNLPPEGIDYVIVNGEVTVAEGEYIGTLNGKILRHGKK